MKKSLLIVAGEPSGDYYGAQIATQIRQNRPDITCLGMGSVHMQKAGVAIRVDSGSLAVMGLFEVFAHLLPIYRAFQTLKKILAKERPTLLLLIDYPAFNLKLAKVAKRMGIPVYYYISPKIWAWNFKRIYKIKQRVDKMLVIFPFEAALYRKAGVPVAYVGHPLVDLAIPTLTQHQMKDQLGIAAHTRVIGLVPGSRKSEIKRLLPIMLESASRLKQRYSNVHFVLPLADNLRMADIAPHLKNRKLPIHITQGQFYNSIQLCCAAIVASGTASLEVALLQVPLLIVYKVHTLTYLVAKCVLQIPHIGLCNIISGKKIVQELVQHAATPAAITQEMIQILENETYSRKIQQSLSHIRAQLGKGGGIANVAGHLCDALN